MNNMHSKQNVNIALLKEDDVQDVEYEGHWFLLFDIPRVNRSLRPVYCGLDPYTGTYRRDIDGDYHCSREEINSMFADANLANPIDGRILKNYGKEDLDEASIKQYRRKFEQAKPDHVWNALSEDDFLEKINVFKKDRKSGERGITYAGLLMFGSYSAIMDENPNFFPDYQEIQDPAARWINRICPDGNWESNLFQFYSRVLPILQNFLPKPFVLRNNQRIEETPAHVAVREALTNALVHADYTENATLNVYKYPNKMVFSNPGTMLISIKQFYKGGESICRNKYLQTMFSFLGSAEKAGSGADKILRGWDFQEWKRPFITERVRPNKVELTMSLESWLDNATMEGLTKNFGQKLDTLTHNQLLTLALTYSEEETSNERLQHALDMHRSDITQMLRELCAKNFLESSGHGRGTTYHLVENNRTNSKSNLFEPKSNLLDSKSNINSSNKLEFSEKSSANKSNISKSNISVHNPLKIKGKKDEHKSNIRKSNTGVKRVRHNKPTLFKMIADYCSDWKTVDEIATVVSLNRDYLRNMILPQLSDVLEKKYNVPRHPRQKYRTKRNSQ